MVAVAVVVVVAVTVVAVAVSLHRGLIDGAVDVNGSTIDVLRATVSRSRHNRPV